MTPPAGGEVELVDLGDPERGGIDDRDVAAAPHEMDRVLRRGLVELVTGRVAPHVQAGLIVSARRHPGSRLCRGGAVPNLREQRRERRRLPRPHVELGHRQADRQKMQMGVVETGAREAAAQIDDARRPADQGLDLAVAAGREHPPAGDRQRPRGTLGEAAEDAAVQEDDLGFREIHSGNDQVTTMAPQDRRETRKLQAPRKGER